MQMNNTLRETSLTWQYQEDLSTKLCEVCKKKLKHIDTSNGSQKYPCLKT